jgi:regulator of sigma E protease
VATLGFIALLNLTAILSVSIGLLNLLPVPVLDGGVALPRRESGPSGARAAQQSLTARFCHDRF